MGLILAVTAHPLVLQFRQPLPPPPQTATKNHSHRQQNHNQAHAPIQPLCAPGGPSSGPASQPDHTHTLTHTHHTAQLPRPSHNIPAGAETKPGHTQPLCVGAQMVWEDPRRISDSPSNLPHLSSHHYLRGRRQGAWKLLEILLSMSNKHSVAHILIRP